MVFADRIPQTRSKKLDQYISFLVGELKCHMFLITLIDRLPNATKAIIKFISSGYAIFIREIMQLEYFIDCNIRSTNLHSCFNVKNNKDSMKHRVISNFNANE